MVEILNGADDGPLKGWSIVICHGQTFLGKPHSGIGGSSLSPVYSLHCVMQMVQTHPQRPPQLMTARQVQPVLTYPSINRVDYPEGAICIPTETLSRDERRDLAKSVAGCEELMGAMRAQEAGLVVVPAGSKLPAVKP